MRFFKNLKKELFILGVASILIGAIMAIFPDLVGKYMGYVIGGVLIVSGGASLIGILVKKGVKPFTFRVIPAALAVAVGFLFIFGANFVYEILWIFIGIAIIMNAYFKNAYAYELKYSGNDKWWWNLVVSMISLALGIILILKPIDTQAGMIVLTGIFMIADGLGDLFSFFIFVNEYARIRKEEKREAKEKALQEKLNAREKKLAKKMAKKQAKLNKKNKQADVIRIDDVVLEAKEEAEAEMKAEEIKAENTPAEAKEKVE